MSIEIKIGAKFYGADGIKQAQRELAKLARAADTYSQSIVAKMARTGKSFEKVGEKLTTKLSLPLIGLGALSVKAFTEQEDAIAKMESVLRSTGGVAGVTSKHITDLASSLQETTTFADEVTVNGAALLLTFKQVRNEFGAGNDVFDRTIKAGQDMSMVLGKDLNSSMMMLGKALNDPEKGLAKLSRAGVQFTREQERQIKVLARSGDVLGAQKIMLAELESQFGGAAEAMAKTAGGRLKAAMNQLGEAGEAIGAEIAPVLATVATSVANLVKKFGDLPGPVRTIVVALGALAAATGPVIWGTGIMLTNLATIGKTKLGTAIIDGFNSLRTAIANAVTQAGSLRAAIAQRLTPALVAGTAGVAALVVGFTLLVQKLNESNEAAARAKFGDIAGNAEKAMIAVTTLGKEGEFKGGLKNLGNLTEAFGFLRAEADRLAIPGGPAQKITEWLGNSDEDAAAASAALNEYDNALRQLLNVDPSAAQEAFRLLKEELLANGVSIEEINAAFPQFLGGLDASKQMAPETRQALEGLGITFGDVEDEISAAEQALKDWADTVKAQFDPVFAYQDAVGDQAEAVKALADAQRNVNDAVAKFGPDSAEAQEAMRQLNTAEQNLIISTGDLDAKQRGLLDGILAGEVPLADAIDTIRRLGAEHGLTAEQIQGQIDKFNFLALTVLNTKFPSVDIQVTSNAAEVLDRLVRIRDAMKDLKAQSDKNPFGATVTADAEGRAFGGPVTAGMPHMVGERGRELFIPSTDGVIVPHYESRRILSESSPATTGPQTTNNVVNVTVNKTEASPYEIGRELLWAMKVAG
jgi:hypothetical protein